MINESRGTPDIVREILNENSKSINLVILNKLNKSIMLSIDKNLNKGKKKVSFICDLKINFHFIDSNTYNGNIKFQRCIESDFKDCEINIFISMGNLDKLKIYKSLSHELTHLYELYQIKDFFKKTSWVKSLNLNKFDALNISTGLIKYFRDIFYASLPHEIRANLSSLEVFLVGLMSNDDKYLRSELIKTTEWSRYMALLEFNPDLFLNDLLDKYNIDFVLNIFNLFNRVLEIKSNDLNDYTDLVRYFNNWKRYFSDIAKKYKSKIDNKIKEIIDSDKLRNDYGTEIYEDRILKYTDYLKDNQYDREIKLDELLKIDYLVYFENQNPIKNKKVIDWVEQNKYNLPDLWDDSLSEEENIEFMINYFTEFPDQMKTEFDNKKISKPNTKTSLRNSVPTLQNIGNFNDFRSF